MCAHFHFCIFCSMLACSVCLARDLRLARFVCVEKRSGAGIHDHGSPCGGLCTPTSLDGRGSSVNPYSSRLIHLGRSSRPRPPRPHLIGAGIRKSLWARAQGELDSPFHSSPVKIPESDFFSDVGNSLPVFCPVYPVEYPSTGYQPKGVVEEIHPPEAW